MEDKEVEKKREEKEKKKEKDKLAQKELSFNIWKRVNPSYAHISSDVMYKKENWSKMEKDEMDNLFHRKRDKHSQYIEYSQKYKGLHTTKK